MNVLAASALCAQISSRLASVFFFFWHACGSHSHENSGPDVSGAQVYLTIKAERQYPNSPDFQLYFTTGSGFNRPVKHIPVFRSIAMSFINENLVVAWWILFAEVCIRCYGVSIYHIHSSFYRVSL